MGRPTRLPASLALAAALALGAQSLAFAQGPARDDAPTIVVTTEVLGAVVSHVAGDAADVSVLMPSGADPHSWQPSARDAERIMAASLVVENGLGLEEGLLGVLEQARAEGIPIFTATDHVELRMTEAEHDHAEGVEHDHAQGLEHDHDVVAHACGHFEDDPLDVSADGSIPDDHTRYTIALTDGSAAVTLERVEAGEVSIFLGSDVPVALSDEAGAEIEAAEMKPVGDACDAIAKAASFDLGAGTFTLELGPTSAVDGVDLVWEEASHHHGDTADEEHHEHEGEEREHAADEEHHDGEGEHAADEEHHEHEGEHGHDHGPEDPHVWLDPVAMRSIVEALVPALGDVGIDVEGQAEAFAAELDALDTEIEAMIAAIPEDQRKLVTGHEALGYFAARYGLEQVGAVIPSVSTSGEPSAQDVAELIATMEEAGVSVVFTDVATPLPVAQAVADATGAEVVPLNVAQLPADGSYVSLMRALTQAIAGALGG